MKKILLFSILLVIPGILYSQWIQTSGPTGGDVQCFGVLGNTIFAGTGGDGIFRSTDEGSTWESLENYSYSSRLEAESFTTAGNTIFSASVNSNIQKSADKGDTWTQIGGSQTFGTRHIVNADSTLYVAASKGIFRNTTWDTNWIYCGNPGHEVRSLSFGASALWAGTDTGLYRSANGGQLWTLVLAGHPINCMAFGSNIIYAGSGSDGVFASENGGISWVPVNSGAFAAPNTLAIAGNEIYAGCWNGIYKSGLSGNINWAQVCNGLDYYRVFSLAVLNTKIFAGTYGGVFRSTDGGTGWSRKNNGLIATSCFIKQSENRLIAGSHTNGFSYTTDKGETWTEISNGLYRYDHVMLDLFDVAFDGSTYYAATENGVYRSPDQGASWYQENTGMTTGYISAVQCAGSYVFAGTGGDGVFRSQKDFIYWTPFNDGLPSDATIENFLLITDTELYVSTWNYGLFRRGISGALPWKSLNNGLGNQTTLIIAGDTISLFTGTQAGLYRSVDEGQNWQKIEDGIIRKTDGIAMKNDTLVIMTEDGLNFSKNKGNTFTEIKNREFFGGRSIVIGSIDVFAGSGDGNGVWRRALSDLHAFNLSVDSVVLNKFINDADSLFIECDTTWTILGFMPEYLSAGPLNGNGDGWVVFHTIQENPDYGDRVNDFMLVSSRGDSAGFMVVQKGKNSGITESIINTVTVYPNPTSGEITITSKFPVKSVRVITPEGIISRELFPEENDKQIPMHLPGSGLFILHITSANQTYVRKVIVFP